jgi:quercetin dioxygenase-like cupin family protein
MKRGMSLVKMMPAIWLLALVLLPGFAAADGYDDGVQAEVLLKATTTSNGQRLQYLKTDKAEVTAMTVRIAPGRETGWHLHVIPVYAYVLSGELTVELADGKRHNFREGQVIMEVFNYPHNGVNTGTTPVKLIVFYTGAEDIPLVKKLSPPAKEGYGRKP